MEDLKSGSITIITEYTRVGFVDYDLVSAAVVMTVTLG